MICLTYIDIILKLNYKRIYTKMLKLLKISLLSVVVMASAGASDILVTVNNKNITKQEAEAFVNASSPGTHFSQLDKAQQDMIKERLVEKILFAELAQEQNLDKHPDFIETLAKIKEELLVSIWMKKQLDNSIVSDGEAKEFYDKNGKNFMDKASVNARHILVKEEKEAQEIIDILSPLKDKALKEKFIELAKEKSTGPSSTNGGDLGRFSKGQMVPEFSQAVWSLDIGKITTKPVKTQFGYHVIYLEKKLETKTIPYSQVKEKIIVALKQKQFTAKVSEIAKELKSKANIVDSFKESNTTQK